ncbi:MAG: helix-turn-helix domain-containing protein [Microbacteriaceae bacterium]|nr:helix-turn-helix domain-containing protein [Microbacteriaceae bacterium]
MSIDVHRGSPLRARLTRATVGSVVGLTAVGRNHVHVRSRLNVAAADPDTLQVAISSSPGITVIEQDGRQATLGVGEILLFDSSRPYRLISEDNFDLQVWALPKSLLRLTNHQSQQITAMPLVGRSGIAGIVHQFLQSTMVNSSALELDSQADAVGEHLVNLVGTLIQSAFGKIIDTPDPSSLLHERVMLFMQQHHADATLDPAAIARAHHVSLRKLHAVFTGNELSVMGLLRSLRLASACRDLNDAQLDLLTIGDIAASHGFPSLAGFTRAYQMEFGKNPSRYRNIYR